jgi:hypothetical protein
MKTSSLTLAALILCFSAARADATDGVRSLGVGLQWTHKQLGGILDDESPGGVSVRYWFNERWGVDAGIGSGFPDVSNSSIFLVAFSAQGMYALKRSGASVLYADVQALPAFARVNGQKSFGTITQSGQNGIATAMAVSAGLGFETALQDFPRARWFLQFNPLSYEQTYPAPGGLTPGAKAFGFLGSNIITTLGFHYQF